jgi:hypothetical protein
MVQAEAVLTQLIFQHSLRIRTNFESPGSRTKDTTGKLMNLITSDLSNITAVVDVWLVCKFQRKGLFYNPSYRMTKWS